MSEKMDLREYKEYAKKTHGSKSINESMLKTMEKMAGGKKMSRERFDAMNADIKMKGVVHGDR
jgi:hypothetical protein